jgi:hypothetical protein
MLKQVDFDVDALTEDDFENVDIDAKIFLADVRIAHVMGEVASRVSSPSSTSLEQTYILQLLSDWISQLPPELALFKPDGTRTPYRFGTCELHIEYFATIIISQALYRHADKRWPCLAACLVASTGMAKLYEELLYREDVAHISNLHAFLCLTAAVPLLYYKPATPEKERQRRDDLAVLHSVIELQRTRYGLAETVAQKLQYLESLRRDIPVQHSAEHVPDAVMSNAHGYRGGADQAAQLNALYPHLKGAAMADNVIAREIMGAAAMAGAVTADGHPLDGQGQGDGGSIWDPATMADPEYFLDATEASAFMDSLFDNGYLQYGEGHVG